MHHHWRVAHPRVVAIHKKGKRTDPKNYRPISLLSDLDRYLKPSYQTKYRALSPHTISSITNSLASEQTGQQQTYFNYPPPGKSLDQGKDTIIALDIVGASDRVWHRGLIATLNSLGIRGHLLHLLQDYLQGRFLRVAMNG
ncbi:uncharacterized protein [Penaeus vannamei]|uniref:uncharacterized protein n=1 Tax=Penaeus vannamei TaxID=6689 RepID=UPI00387F4FEF